jgi:hypothetical protein
MSARRVHEGGAWTTLSATEKLDAIAMLMWELAANLPRPYSRNARQRVALLHLQSWKAALDTGEPVDLWRELRNVGDHFRYYQLQHDKRFASALWQTLSPRTHGAAKRALQMFGRGRA